jgi:hypothetical protein
VATPEVTAGPARRLDPTLAAVGSVLEPLDPTPPAAEVVLHAPVLPATSSVLPSVATNPVASNTRPGAPVSNNSPLPSAPSHGRFMLSSEKIEILSRKPTRAQVVQVTTNLLRDSCPYAPVDVVHHDDYLSFESLLMRQYVSQPFKMDECAQWKSWGRKRFCEELLKAVPDISVARPESSANFVELIAQVVIRFDLADPSVEESVDQTIQAIVHRFTDAKPAQHLRAVKILTSRLPELPINWRIILSRLINGAEVNLTTVNGFRVTWLAQLDRARLAKEQAEEYGFEVGFTSNTRLNVDKPILKRAVVNEKPSASSNSASGLVCSGCGNSNHMVDTCRFRSNEFFNSYPQAYKGSKVPQKLLATYPDVSAIPFSLLSKGKSTSSSSRSAQSKYGPRPAQGKSPTISDIISTMYSDNSVNNYIDVSVSATLQASTRRRNNVKALLDTSSLALLRRSRSSIWTLYFDR